MVVSAPRVVSVPERPAAVSDETKAEVKDAATDEVAAAAAEDAAAPVIAALDVALAAAARLDDNAAAEEEAAAAERDSAMALGRAVSRREKDDDQHVCAFLVSSATHEWPSRYSNESFLRPSQSLNL